MLRVQPDVATLPSMESLIGQFASLSHIKKIGEGTFGEAFKADEVVFADHCHHPALTLQILNHMSMS